MDGTVSAFDEGRGRGVIATPDGAVYEFHATRLVDGSRRIAVGAAVRFSVAPAPLGRWEATEITRC
ncbi:MAG: hypothetical protein JWL83_971 [Actinomycetia bacterium]|nr:hypothetical protein [Actinomycetes bacterium]